MFSTFASRGGPKKSAKYGYEFVIERVCVTRFVPWLVPVRGDLFSGISSRINTLRVGIDRTVFTLGEKGFLAA